MKKLLSLIMIVLLSQVVYAQPDIRISQSTQAMVGLGLEEGIANRLNERLKNYGVDEALQVHQQIRQTLQQGLPVGPVVEKAHEGLAKQAGPEAVVRAMRQVRERYAYAYGWAGSLVDDPRAARSVGDSIADAMAAGLQAGDLDRIRDRLRARDCDAALCRETALTLREMTRTRVSSGTAADTVDEALRKGYQAKAMRQMRESFAYQARSGNATAIAKGYQHAIRGGSSAGSLGGSSSGYNGGSNSAGPGSGPGASSGARGGNGNGHGGKH